tara:strand:- start:1778 stop:2293 length:516 start_codon:yes stop_codon:yes gene_type:complete
MATILPSGFSITNVDPIDARFSVSNQTARLGFSAANVYEGLVVYQQDTNELYVLTDTGSYNSTGGWTLVGSGAGSTFMATGSVTSSVNVTGDIFIIKSGSYNPFTVSSTGLTTISGSAANLFLIKNASNEPILTVSQSGVVILATSSVVLTGTAPNGGIYFTSNSLFVGLD